MLKEHNEPTNQPDLEQVKQSHTKLIQEQEQLDLEKKQISTMKFMNTKVILNLINYPNEPRF